MVRKNRRPKIYLNVPAKSCNVRLVMGPVLLPRQRAQEEEAAAIN